MSSSRRLLWIARFERAWVSSRRTITWPALTTSPLWTRSSSDDAAGRVLNLLDVGVNDDHARSHYGARQLRGGRPAAHADPKQSDGRSSGNKMRPDCSKPHVVRHWHVSRPR